MHRPTNPKTLDPPKFSAKRRLGDSFHELEVKQ